MGNGEIPSILAPDLKIGDRPAPMGSLGIIVPVVGAVVAIVPLIIHWKRGERALSAVGIIAVIGLASLTVLGSVRHRADEEAIRSDIDKILRGQTDDATLKKYSQALKEINARDAVQNARSFVDRITDGWAEREERRKELDAISSKTSRQLEAVWLPLVGYLLDSFDQTLAGLESKGFDIHHRRFSDPPLTVSSETKAKSEPSFRAVFWGEYPQQLLVTVTPAVITSGAVERGVYIAFHLQGGSREEQIGSIQMGDKEATFSRNIRPWIQSWRVATGDYGPDVQKQIKDHVDQVVTGIIDGFMEAARASKNTKTPHPAMGW